MRTLSEKRMSLLTKPEAELVLSSAPSNVRELDARQLRTRIQRARRMIDKYEGKARTQHREATGRKTPTRSRRAEGADNTRTKTRYFEQSLARFEKQLERVEKRQAKERPHAPGPRASRARPGAAKRTTVITRSVKRSAPEEREWRATKAAAKSKTPRTSAASRTTGSTTRRRASMAAATKNGHTNAAPARRRAPSSVTGTAGHPASAPATRSSSKRTASTRRGHTPAKASGARGAGASTRSRSKVGTTTSKAAGSRAPASRRTRASATSTATSRSPVTPASTSRKGVSARSKGGARKLQQNLVTQRQARAGGHGRRTQARKDAR